MTAFVRTVLTTAALVFAASAGAAPITTSNNPAMAGATVVTFDNVGTTNFLSMAFGNVTFSSNNGSQLSIHNYSGQYGTTGNSLGNPSYQSFDAIFTNTVSAFDVVIGAVNSGWTFKAYGVNNNLIETLNMNDACCGGFARGIAAQGIKRVTFTPASDWATFDNFRFVENKVPEPGSLALLGLGLLGFMASRRKKA